MLKSALQQLGSDATAGVRRTVAIIIVVAAVAFLAFIIWIAAQYRASNGWSEIREVVDPVVVWTVLAVVTACAAVIVDGTDRRHALRLAQAQAQADPRATAAAPGGLVVSTRAWRGTALAGLAVVAFSLALVSSNRLGHLRSTTAFGLRGNGSVSACAATLLAPSIATTDDHVAIDLSVYCKDAPPQQMPAVSASFGPENGTSSKVVTSFTGAKTLRQNERVWRWFVTFDSGEQPLDVRVTFLGDHVVVPLSRIVVARPTTLGSLQEQTTALGGLLGAVIGVLGTIGSLFKSWRGSSVVTPDQG
jgi:hypothetical protein